MRKMKLFSAFICTSMALAGCASAPISASMASTTVEKVISDDAIRASQFTIEPAADDIDEGDNPLELIVVSDQNGQKIDSNMADDDTANYESEYYNLDIIYSVVNDQDEKVRIRYTLRVTDYTSDTKPVTSVTKTFTFKGTLDNNAGAETSAAEKVMEKAKSSEKSESDSTTSSTSKRNNSTSSSSSGGNSSNQSSAIVDGKTSNSTSSVSNNNSMQSTIPASTPVQTCRTVHHDAVYQTVHHDEVGHYETQTTYQTRGIIRCYCGAIFYSGAEYDAHLASYFGDEYWNHAGYHTDIIQEPVTTQVWVVDSAAYDEQVLVSNSYDEQVCE